MAIVFTHEYGFVTRAIQSNLETPDPCKESGDGQALRLVGSAIPFTAWLHPIGRTNREPKLQHIP